jgi:hypothetical protein
MSDAPKIFAEDPAGAGIIAKQRKCETLPAGRRVSMTDVDVDTKTACVVPIGEKRCVWILTGKTVSVD